MELLAGIYSRLSVRKCIQNLNRVRGGATGSRRFKRWFPRRAPIFSGQLRFAKISFSPGRVSPSSGELDAQLGAKLSGLARGRHR